MNSEPVPSRSREVRVLGKDSLTLLMGLIWKHLNEDQRWVLEGLGLKPAGVESPRAPGERRSRHIPNDVKIEVAVRVRAGASSAVRRKICTSSTRSLLRGRGNTVRNIQLMSGPCDRREDAEDLEDEGW